MGGCTSAPKGLARTKSIIPPQFVSLPQVIVPRGIVDPQSVQPYLTSLSTAPGIVDGEPIPVSLHGWLVPHEGLRTEFVRIATIFDALDKLPAAQVNARRLSRFAKYYVEFLFPLIDHHHHTEETIVRTTMEAWHASLPKEQRSKITLPVATIGQDHKALVEQLTNIRNVLAPCVVADATSIGVLWRTT